MPQTSTPGMSSPISTRYDLSGMSSSWTRIAFSLSLLLPLGLADQAEAAPPSTTHAFEITDGGNARVFFLNRERQIPLRVRNDGFVTWLPNKEFKFSYHWFSPGGVSLEEGFRTRLPAKVAPGESVALEARVKNLPPPGIYRLQWDLVHEGVTWFSEKDRTPEPARWAVVLPPLELFMALLLPCAVAIGAFLLTRLSPGRRPPGISMLADGADLIWAAVALYGMPFLLYAELPRRFIPGITWTNGSAVAIPLLVLLAFPRRWRAWAAWCAVAFGALLVWGQTVYLRFFGDVATSAAVLASRQTGEIRESIGFLSTSTDWWLAIDLVVALPLIMYLGRKSAGTPRRLTPAIFLLILAIPFLGGLADLSDFTRGRNLRALRDVMDYGLYGYHILDGASLAAKSMLSGPPSDGEVEDVVRWFKETAESRAPVGPAAGKASSYNLVAIQAESMQQFVLDFDVAGEPITPNLRRLASSALLFTSVQDQTSRGRSSAGDYVVNTSVLPMAESVAYQYSGNAHRGLAHALSERGYVTLSAIPYKQHFWNRYRTHPAYGFETNLFVGDFEPGPEVGWGLNDSDFLRQMVPRLQKLEQPFFAWLTTLSVHHPYAKFPSELKTLQMGELEGTALGNYLHGMNLLDRAVGEFFSALAMAGLRDNTVVVLWGDHSSGLLREERWVEHFDLADSGAERFQFRRVPLLVWVPGTEDLRGRIDRPAGQMDIAPTLLALLGGDPRAEPFLGRNLLGAPGETPVVHPQGSWITEDLLYLNPREDVETVRCWNPQSLRPQKAAACRAVNPQARRQIEISEMILEHDLQETIRQRLRE
jgi:phosphoglycerol transferase MdoB-like AlkP superfamily enzyme